MFQHAEWMIFLPASWIFFVLVIVCNIGEYGKRKGRFLLIGSFKHEVFFSLSHENTCSERFLKSKFLPLAISVKDNYWDTWNLVYAGIVCTFVWVHLYSAVGPVCLLVSVVSVLRLPFENTLKLKKKEKKKQSDFSLTSKMLEATKAQFGAKLPHYESLSKFMQKMCKYPFSDPDVSGV